MSRVRFIQPGTKGSQDEFRTCATLHFKRRSCTCTTPTVRQKHIVPTTKKEQNCSHLFNIRLNIAVAVQSLKKERKPKKIGDVRSPARQQCHRRWQKSELADRSICNNLYSVIAMDTCNTTKCRCTSNFGKQILIASPHEEKKIL